MEVNDTLVDKLANLARLQFDNTEKSAIKNDLQRMIQFVEKLNELDTTGVSPLLHMSNNVNALREDEIKGSIFGPGNKPDNFGVYERWVINKVENNFEDNNPKIEFANHDFMMLISGQFNDKIRKGFNKVKKRR